MMKLKPLLNKFQNKAVKFVLNKGLLSVANLRIVSLSITYHVLKNLGLTINACNTSTRMDVSFIAVLIYLKRRRRRHKALIILSNWTNLKMKAKLLL